MNKKSLSLTLAVPVLGLAIYTIFHDCQRQNCFFCRYNKAITFTCGGATAVCVWQILKE